MVVEDETPVISFAERIHDLMCQVVKRMVVVRLLGKTIGYKVLCNRFMAT